MEAVENALLSCFIRLQPSDLAIVESGSASEIDALKGKLATNRANTEALKERILNGSVNATILELADTMDKQRKELETELENLQQLQAVERSSNLAQTQTLIGHLESLKGTELLNARIALKTQIAQQVERIELDIKSTKTADIRCRFKNGITFILSGADNMA